LETTILTPYEIAFYPSIRQENFTFGLDGYIYPHAYFLEKLLRLISIKSVENKPSENRAKLFEDFLNVPDKYHWFENIEKEIEEVKKNGGKHDLEEEIEWLINEYQACIERAREFLAELNNPIIYDDINIVQDRRKAEFIIGEATLLKRMVEQAREIQIIKKSIEIKTNDFLNKADEEIQVIRSIDTETEKYPNAELLLMSLIEAEETINDEIREIQNQSESRLTGLSLEPIIESKNVFQKVNKQVEKIVVTKSKCTDDYRKVDHRSYPVVTSKDIGRAFEFAFKYKTTNFITIPWLELLEIIKNNLPINRCETCDNYYFDALRSETRKYCKVCGPPSRRKGEKKIDQDRRNIVSYIQRGYLSLEEGQQKLKDLGFKKYKPRKKTKKKNKGE